MRADGSAAGRVFFANLCLAAVALRSSNVERQPPEGLGADALLSFDDLDYVPEPKTVKREPASMPPSGLRGKNLLFVGDSNDRKILKHLCARYGAEFQNVSSPLTCGDQRLFFPTHNYLGVDYSPSSVFFCHIPEMNMSIMNLFHFGAMTMAPEPQWHFEALRDSALGFWYLLPSRSDPSFFVNPTDAIVANTSAADLVCFWRSAVKRELPERPFVLVAQSSLWDTLVAHNYLIKHNFPNVLSQTGLEHVGWKSASTHPGLEAWDWQQKTSAFMELVRDEFKPQKFFWRTTPNCPLEGDWVEMARVVADLQSEAVRSLIDARKGVWSEVELIDWRKNYVAKLEDCSWQHYTSKGYENFIDLLHLRLGLQSVLEKLA